MADSDRPLLLNAPPRYSHPVSSQEDIGAALRRHRERRGLSLDQVGRRVGLGKTGVQAIETGRSGASVGRLEEVAAAVGAEIVVTVRAAGDAEVASELATAAALLSPERRALLLRVALAAAEVDDALLRGFVDGLDLWASTARAHRNMG